MNNPAGWNCDSAEGWKIGSNRIHDDFFPPKLFARLILKLFDGWVRILRIRSSLSIMCTTDGPCFPVLAILEPNWNWSRGQKNDVLLLTIISKWHFQRFESSSMKKIIRWCAKQETAKMRSSGRKTIENRCLQPAVKKEIKLENGF